MNAHSSLTCKSQKWKTSQASINTQMKSTVNRYNGMVLRNKEGWRTDSCDNMDKH